MGVACSMYGSKENLSVQNLSRKVWLKVTSLEI